MAGVTIVPPSSITEIGVIVMRTEVAFYTNSSCMINDQNNRKSAEKACWVYTCKGSLYYHLDCESNIRQITVMPCWMR